MTEWTNPAKAAFERYCSRMRESMVNSGADASEVIEDLKRHIETEAEAAQLRMVTEEDVRRILARIGDPALLQEAPKQSVVEPTQKRPGIVVLLFGVFLPIAAIVIELATHMCAAAFFDPIPTLWHVFLVFLVPLANFGAWWAVRIGHPAWRNRLGLANGLAIGIGAYYTLLYLPLMLPAVFALLFFGWGLLPMAPLFSLISAIALRSRLSEFGAGREGHRLPGLWCGLAGAAIALAIIVLPVPATHYFARMAASATPAVSSRGIHWLRAFGQEQTLLRDCYGTGRWIGENPLS